LVYALVDVLITPL